MSTFSCLGLWYYCPQHLWIRWRRVWPLDLWCWNLSPWQPEIKCTLCYPRWSVRDYGKEQKNFHFMAVHNTGWVFGCCQ